MSEIAEIVRFGRVRGEIGESPDGGRPPGMPWAEVSRWLRVGEDNEDPRAVEIDGKEGLWLLQAVSYPLAPDDGTLESWPLDEKGDLNPEAPSYFDLGIDPRMELIEAEEYARHEKEWENYNSQEEGIKRLPKELRGEEE